MKYPIAIDLNVTMRDVCLFNLLKIESSLCNLLVCLDDIYLFGAGVVKPVTAA